MPSINDLFEKSKVIVILGSGGVGKTTVSASVGVAAARAGLKVLVLTIDPAKRLADALGGLDSAEEPTEIPPELWNPNRDSSAGRLFAMMLDQKLTFDRLVDRFAPTPEQAEAVKKNQWYQQMSSALSGAQEYMAVSKLYEITESQSYDLTVLDTPPTSNVLDFLEAPEKLRNLLKLNRLSWFREKLEQSTAGRFIKWGSGSFFKLIGRITGQAVIDEILKLLDDLSIFAADFEQHSRGVQKLLHSPRCNYLQVAIPTHRTVLETLFLRQKLKRSGLNSPWIAVNRLPLFIPFKDRWLHISEESLKIDEKILTDISDKLLEKLPNFNRSLVNSTIEKLYKYYQNELIISENSREELQFLFSRLEDSPPVVFLPALYGETADLSAIEKLSSLMADSQFQLRAKEVVLNGAGRIDRESQLSPEELS